MFKQESMLVEKERMLIEERAFHWDEILSLLEREKIVLKWNERMRSVVEHDHNFLELTYIFSGEVEHTLNGQVTRLVPGDYLIVDHGSIHSYKTLSKDGYDNLDCLFRPELLDPSLKGFNTLRSVLEHYLLHFNIQAFVQNPARMVFHDDHGRVKELLFRMKEEVEHREAGYTELVRCCLIELLILTMRKLDDAQALATGQDISAFLTAYVAEHYMEELTLCDLAARLKYSLPYVSKRFKEDTGVNFVRYLQNYRVAQGCRLLVSSDRTVSEIAEMVGYHDVKFFSGLIRRETGLSPSEYRRRRGKIT